jgi:DNA repair protein RadC
MIKRGRRYVPADPCDVLSAATELQVRELDGSICDAPEHTRCFLSRLIGKCQVEQFVCVWLDNRHRVITSDVMFTGTIDRASIHPREVVRRCIERNAAAVILAHNHPSGVLEVSQADELITRRIREALALLDVRVLDHFIVADDKGISFAEHGLL